MWHAGDARTSISLYRERWYGWDHLRNGSDGGYKSRTNANAKWYCVGAGTYTYLGESYHRVTISGKNYVAYTDNSDRFAC